MAANVRVRPAFDDDPMLLATLQQSWWRESYRDVLPATVLDMAPDQLAAAWELQLAVGKAFIAEERTHPVGFALISPQVDDEVGAIELIGVVPRWARRGHGGRLMAECARHLRDLGAQWATWWAVERDVSIANFTESIGWQQSGQRRIYDTGEGRLAEIEYCGSLDLQTVIFGGNE